MIDRRASWPRRRCGDGPRKYRFCRPNVPANDPMDASFEYIDCREALRSSANPEKKWTSTRIWRAIALPPGYSGGVNETLSRPDVRAVRTGIRRSHPAMSRHALTVALFLWVLATAEVPAAENSARRPNLRPDSSADAASASNLTDADDTGAPRAATPRNPRVLFIVDGDCPRCREELARLRKPGGVFEAMQTRGWKIGETPDCHVQIVERDVVSDLVEALNVREFPTVACISDGEIVRSFKEGCTTPLDGWTFGFLLTGKSLRPRGTVLEAARVASTGSYPLRGNHWSIEGDWNPSKDKLVGHLRGPNHGHQIAASYAIEVWSYEELRSLHDDLHERELASGGTAVASGSSSGSYYYPRSQGPSGGTNFHNAAHKMLGR